MNVQITTDNHLCNSCGTCKSVCPQNAITFTETASGQMYPVIDKSLCNSCQKCLKLCQGYNFLNTNIKNIKNIFQGNVICSFIGKSNDESIYINSQSGGIATALGLAILDDKEVDGILVTSMTNTNPPRPYNIIAKNKEQLLLSQKSKYCPTPLMDNICQILDNVNKIAMVGLPCHIHSAINICKEFPKYNGKIKYKIGLICDRVMSYRAIDYLLKTAEVNPNHKISLNYRNKSSSGFPGDVTIKTNDASYILPAQKRMEVKNYFTLTRCLLCFDKMNIFSDITVGDPHGVKNYDKIHGESSIIVRNLNGLSLINYCLKNNYISIRDINADEIFEGQKIESIKKNQWHGYTSAWKQLGLKIPTAYEKIEIVQQYMNNDHINQVSHSINISKCNSKNTIIDTAITKFKNHKYSRRIQNVEIKGVGFINKGAELMLESILQHYNNANLQFAMEPLTYNSSYKDRAKKGILQKLNYEGKDITGIPEEFHKIFGLIKDTEIDAVLDASGFSYGEQWGRKRTEEMAWRIQRWKKQGTKVILLPQAFGPFMSPSLKTAMRSIVTNADIVFARDKESYSHLTSLKIPCENVYIAPDFTNITKGITPVSPHTYSKKMCIIPNAMIYRKLSDELSQNYITALKSIIESSIIKNIECFILIHEGVDDLKIGIELQKIFGKNLSIITENDPLRVKGIIGSCYAVASSRFHGVVSALSQNIPTLCIGWSHKYQMLMSDYDNLDYMLELDSNTSNINEKTISIIDDTSNKILRKKLLEYSNEQKKLTLSMWKKIDSILLH